MMERAPARPSRHEAAQTLLELDPLSTCCRINGYGRVPISMTGSFVSTGLLRIRRPGAREHRKARPTPGLVGGHFRASRAGSYLAPFDRRERAGNTAPGRNDGQDLLTPTAGYTNTASTGSSHPRTAPQNGAHQACRRRKATWSGAAGAFWRRPQQCRRQVFEAAPALARVRHRSGPGQRFGSANHGTSRGPLGHCARFRCGPCPRSRPRIGPAVRPRRSSIRSCANTSRRSSPTRARPTPYRHSRSNGCADCRAGA